MLKRSLFFAFPAACLAALVAMAACGGSGGGHTPSPATLSEAVSAVRSASTPAQGQFAYSQVISYLGVTVDPNYVGLAADVKANLTENIGAAIATDNTNPPAGSTYGAALTSFAATFSAAVPPATAVAQLNTDITAAASIPATPAHDDLLLIAALDGGGATLDKHISPAAAYSLARWFAKRYGTVPAPLTRGPCQQGCLATYNIQASGAYNFFITSKAIMIFLYQAGFLTLERAAFAIFNLQLSYDLKIESFRNQYNVCIASCHGQG